MAKRKKVLIRNLNSTRPWQHVLEVLSGYIRLAYVLNKNRKLHGEAFNFGPNSKNYKVVEILKRMKKFGQLSGGKLKKIKNFLRIRC